MQNTRNPIHAQAWQDENLSLLLDHPDMDISTPHIRVLIADDHPMVVAGIRAFLSTHSHIEIVGEATDGNDVLGKARTLKPDVILMDISMPVLNGFEATKILYNELPATDIIIITMHDDKEYIRQIINSGAQGYVLKNAPQEDILKAIESVYQGDAFFSPEISKTLLEDLRVKNNEQPEPAELTDLERKIIILLAEDYSSKEIADKLCVSPRTIEKQRTRIMQKLNMRSVVGLTRYAISHGLVKP